MKRSDMGVDELLDLVKKQADSLQEARTKPRTKDIADWMCRQADALSSTAKILSWKLEDLGP